VAVYTNISFEEINEIASKYPIGNVKDFIGITEGVSNSNFLLVTADDKYIYTIFEDVVSKDDLPYFLGLMLHLSGKGISCPQPIADNNNEYIYIVKDKSSLITSFLSGKSTKRISNAHCKSLGESMSKMHLASEGFQQERDNDSSVFSVWDRVFPLVEDRVNEISIDLKDELISAHKLIESNWPTNLSKGVIHGDLFPDNVFFNGDDVSGIIDFYYACNDYYIYDLSICMNSWCFEENASFNITKAKNLLLGYNNVRQLSDDELESLPILCAGAALRFLLTRIYDFLNQDESANVVVKDPIEKLKILRFHMQVKTVREYGI